MYKKKIIISITFFVSFLIITSIIKNKTRVIEKKIFNINEKILLKKKDFNETQLDFYYLSSPSEIENKLNLAGLNNFSPIKFSNIFFDINDFMKIKNKTSDIKDFNEKTIQKK